MVGVGLGLVVIEGVVVVLLAGREDELGDGTDELPGVVVLLAKGLEELRDRTDELLGDVVLFP